MFNLIMPELPSSPSVTVFVRKKACFELDEDYTIISEDENTAILIMPKAEYEYLQTLVRSGVIDFIIEIRLVDEQ